jgi:hypothetical protein
MLNRIPRVIIDGSHRWLLIDQFWALSRPGAPWDAPGEELQATTSGEWGNVADVAIYERNRFKTTEAKMQPLLQDGFMTEQLEFKRWR